MEAFYFVLKHMHGSTDEVYMDNKFLGVYSDMERVNEAIRHFRSQPGFSEYPNGFYICPYATDDTALTEVWIVACYFHDEEYIDEYDEFLGVFSTEEKAQCAADEFIKCNKESVVCDKERIYAGLLEFECLQCELFVDKETINQIPMLWKEGFDSGVACPD